MKNEIKSESAPASSGDTMQRARYCPLCGTQFSVLKGHPNPWSPDIKRNQLDGYEALLAERDRLREALKMCADALHTIGDGAGDVPDWNEGGEYYEACEQARAALAEGAKTQPKLKTAAALRCQDTEFLHYPKYSMDDTGESEPL